jgi:hypothetical protein
VSQAARKRGTDCTYRRAYCTYGATPDANSLEGLHLLNGTMPKHSLACYRASLRYTGIDSHYGLTHYGLYDTVVAKD